jgi:hypothetical protein
LVSKPYKPTYIASIVQELGNVVAKKRERNLSRRKRRPTDMVVVNDRMQSGYSYLLTQPIGRNFEPQFRPDLTPKEMLALGIFCGKYMTDCQKEFPASWFARAKLSPRAVTAPSIISVSTPVSRFRCGAGRAGFIRMIPAAGSSGIAGTIWAAACPDEDARQIKRWKAIRRHVLQLRRHCEPGDPTCRPRQRQALLHWAYDSRRI